MSEMFPRDAMRRIHLSTELEKNDARQAPTAVVFVTVPIKVTQPANDRLGRPPNSILNFAFGGTGFGD